MLLGNLLALYRHPARQISELAPVDVQQACSGCFETCSPQMGSLQSTVAT